MSDLFERLLRAANPEPPAWPDPRHARTRRRWLRFWSAPVKGSGLDGAEHADDSPLDS